MIEISSIEQWEELLKASREKPLVILKHSNTCPVSAAAYEKMTNGEQNDRFSVYIVMIQENRDISNKIAKDLSVKHESPQVIVIKDGVSVYSESHFKIEPGKVEQALSAQKTDC